MELVDSTVADEPTAYAAETKTRKIALVGTASSNINAPVDDPDWEIWGVSARASHITRATRWFELHDIEAHPREWARSWRSELKAKVTHDCELMMMPQFLEPNLGPRVVPYPYQRIVRRFGAYFMTSTFAWMTALAIDELRPENASPIDGEIFVCGVEMEYGTEYRHQRAGFRHFMDVAQLLGIPVTRLAASGLALEPVPYPFWQGDPLQAVMEKRFERTKETLDNLDKSLKATGTLIAQDNAIAAEIERMKKGDYDADKRLASVRKEIEKNTATHAKILGDMRQERGEHEAYASMLDLVRTA